MADGNGEDARPDPVQEPGSRQGNDLRQLRPNESWKRPPAASSSTRFGRRSSASSTRPPARSSSAISSGVATRSPDSREPSILSICLKELGFARSDQGGNFDRNFGHDYSEGKETELEHAYKRSSRSSSSIARASSPTASATTRSSTSGPTPATKSRTSCSGPWSITKAARN